MRKTVKSKNNIYSKIAIIGDCQLLSMIIEQAKNFLQISKALIEVKLYKKKGSIITYQCKKVIDLALQVVSTPTI